MNALRRTRVDARLSVEELATKSGVSAEQIRNIESGRAMNPRPATLGSLADALKDAGQTVSPSDLMPVKEAA